MFPHKNGMQSCNTRMFGCADISGCKCLYRFTGIICHIGGIGIDGPGKFTINCIPWKEITSRGFHFTITESPQPPPLIESHP